MVKAFTSRTILSFLAVGATSCTTIDAKELVALAREIYELERAERPEKTPSTVNETPTPTPEATASPTATPTPEPIQTPRPPEEKPVAVKPGLCSDTNKVVKGHHGPDDVCKVGGEKKGCSVLKFTGGRGGLECLKSNTTGELKCGLPWNYDCAVSQEVKVCGVKGCVAADKTGSEWVNWDLTSNGKMCTQWHRWRQSPENVFKKTGEPLELIVGTCRVKWCDKQWKKEKRCS